MKWRGFVAWLALVALAFLVGFANEYHWPRIKTWLLVELEALSDTHLPARILAQDLSVSLWPPGLAFYDLKILPKGDLAKTLAPVAAEQVLISPNFSGLFSGSFGIAKLTVIRPQVTVILRDLKPEADERRKIFRIADLLKLPVGHLALQKMLFQSRIDRRQLLTQVTDLDLTVELTNSGAMVKLDTPKISFKKKEAPARMTVAVETRFAVSDSTLQISSLHIQKGRSYLLASGSVTGDLSQKRVDKSDLISRGFFDLEEIRSWLAEIAPEIRLPALHGTVRADTTLKKIGTSPPELEVSAQTQELAVDGYLIGEIELNGRSDTNFYSFPEIKITNEAGSALFSNSVLHLHPSPRLQTEMNLKQVELSRLLRLLKVGEVPVHLLVSGRFPCSLHFAPQFDIQCQGGLTAEDLHVTSGDAKSTVVQIEKMAAEGTVRVTSRQVSYQAKLAFAPTLEGARTSGTSNGTIRFAEGFHINYTAEKLDFKDVKNLANLKFDGKARISGTTSGDSRSAVIDMNLAADQFWFEDIALGSVKTQASYRNGTLYLKKIAGHLGSTSYSADAAIELNRQRLNVRANFPNIDASDLQSAFRRKFSAPFGMAGNGHARIALRGPLDIRKLSYTSELQLLRGSFGVESYNELALAVRSQDGHAVIEKAQVLKGNSSIVMSGEAWPDGRIVSGIKGRNLQIEDSELAKLLGLNMKGTVVFDAKISGDIERPQSSLSGSLTNLKLGANDLPPSKFNIQLNHEEFRADGVFFGGKVKGEIDFPFVRDRSFHLETRADNWDFIPILGLLNPEVDRLNYRGVLSGGISLQSPDGDLWKSSGSISLERFLLFRDEVGFENKAPIAIKIKDGVADGNDLVLEGPGAFVKTTLNRFSAQNLESQTNGKVDLSLLAFATPFLEDIQGTLSVAFKTGGHKNKPEILGSIFLEEGYFKLPKFPHPLESLKADLLFSQSKFLVNSLSAQLAGGQLQVDGSVQFEGLNRLPTNLNVSVSDVAIAYPEQVNSKSSAKLKVSGTWFPFLLSGKIDIENALVRRELSDFSAQSKTVRESPFLPDLFVKTESKLFSMDLSVGIIKSIAIKNSLIDTELKGQLDIEGSLMEPELKGALRAQGGQLFFRKTPFNISEATVNFPGGKQMNPALYFTAETRVKDFDVAFLLQGTAEKPEISLSSQPALPDQEIISLLALGVTSSDLENKTEGAYQARSTALIGLSQGLSREIKDQFGLNLQVSQDVSSTEAVQKITISREFFRKFEAAASKSVGNEDIDVKLEYRVNKNFSLIGSWQSLGASETLDITEKDSGSSSKLGLDLELKFEFK